MEDADPDQGGKKAEIKPVPVMNSEDKAEKKSKWLRLKSSQPVICTRATYDLISKQVAGRRLPAIFRLREKRLNPQTIGGALVS